MLSGGFIPALGIACTYKVAHGNMLPVIMDIFLYDILQDADN